MHREIKFRVWDLLNNRMILKPFKFYINLGFDNSQPISKINAPYFFYENYSDYEDGESYPCIIMEYTNKKDKNGNEIFENDIIKITQAIFDFVLNDYKYEEKISYVEYLDRGFWIHDESFGWEGENLWNWNNIEVIGNLYEQPNLYHIN